MKNNKKQGRCPFSPFTLLAVLLLIGGMLAIIHNVTVKGRCPVKMPEKGIRYFVFRHDIDGVIAMTDCRIARDVLKSF